MAPGLPCKTLKGHGSQAQMLMLLEVLLELLLELLLLLLLPLLLLLRRQ